MRWALLLEALAAPLDEARNVQLKTLAIRRMIAACHVRRISVDLFRGIRQPCRNIAATVKHAPYFQGVGAFAVEHQIGKSLQRPAAQSRDVEFVGMARRTGGWMLLNVTACLFEGIDEAQRERRRFVQDSSR